MKKNKPLYFLFVLLGITNFILAQKEEKFRFKKNNSLIYFFQQGQEKDTIQKTKGDLFYLVVPDSLKAFLLIQVDNAQLIQTENDSLVRLNYVKGFNYESLYITEEYAQTKKKSFSFKTLMNGVSPINPDKIEIKFIDKREKNVLLKNEFYFIPKN